jgi:hypothetical protein
MAAAALAAPPLTVLLVEDDAADAVLVEEFFDSHSYPADLRPGSRWRRGTSLSDRPG